MLENNDDLDSGPLIPAKKTCARYNIVDRTLDRWLANEDLRFPRPVVINKRRYFREKRLEAWERTRAGTVKTGPA